jgi:hypothetical protein
MAPHGRPFDLAPTRGQSIGYGRGDRDFIPGRPDYAVAFGRAFIANPDLPERLRQKAILNPPQPETFYGPGAEGYTDYPALSNASQG